MTGPRHDWRRTHAVLVAVEAYQGHPDWDLDGPVSDALKVMGWLVEQGVPRENIQLLASPLARNEGLLAQAPPSWRPAQRGNIRHLFREELRRIDGEWLWIYWAGHGVQAGDRWSLLYPESRDRDLVGVDTDNLIHLLRTDRLPHRGVDRVTVIIDACREALPVRQQALAAPPDRLWEEPQTHHDRRIFLMRASHPGGTAKNRDGAGLFTSVLLEQLAKAGHDGAAVDLDRVWHGVSGEFERLRRDEGIRQFPTLHVSDWDGTAREFAVEPLRDPRHRRARQQLVFETERLLAAAAGGALGVAARLCPQLDTEPPATTPPTGGELVDWALADPRGAATLLHALAEAAPGETVQPGAHEASCILQNGQWLTRAEYGALVALLSRLDPPQRDAFERLAGELLRTAPAPAPGPAPLVDVLEGLTRKQDQLPQLLRVVEWFAAPDQSRVAVELQEWSMACATRLGLVGALRERRIEAEDRAADDRAVDERVQVRLGPPDGPGHRRGYEVWLSRRDGASETVSVVDDRVPLEEIQRALDDVLNRYARTDRTVVEFFLAYTDLHLEVHRWPRGTAGPARRTLGTDFPVVVRSAELRDERPEMWKKRWARVETSCTTALYWPPGDMDSTALHTALQAREDSPGAVITTAVPDRPQQFAVCLFSGVPVLVWHAEAERESAEAVLAAMLGAEQLHSLPHHVHRLRSLGESHDRHPGKHLALLWDDPHRPLPQLELSAP
ncbi:caspase family protein [Streptomyces sp. YGL11-2]|uniref:VMAP-C domain-containing protein n=1 Tax=Streptomyces sp. YGL11-2 TaxID=3414028 RepID=UPI003CE7D4C8